MRILPTALSHRLELRGGGGAVALFGLPFLLAGLFVMGLGSGLVPAQNGPPAAVGLLFGAVFAGVGAVLVFGRSGCVLDTRHGTVTRWWGLLGPWWRRERSLAELDRVTMTREVRRSDKSTYTVFPVRLAGNGEAVTLAESRKEETARKLAEDVAKFLGFPLADSSTGAEVVREADSLDASVRERAVLAGSPELLPERPADLRCRIRRKADAVMIEIPAAGGHPVAALLTIMLFVPALGVLGFVYTVFRRSGGEGRFLVPVLACSATALVVMLLVVRKRVLRMGGPTRVIVSARDGVQVTNARGRTTTIPAEELEEVVVPQMPPELIAQQAQMPAFVVRLMTAAAAGKLAIIARSDRETLRFGGHLAAPEREYVGALIRYVLCT